MASKNNNTNLYPHNQEAYEKVMAHYAAGHRRAAVIQPTGTGKSYMGGAVASHFKKVLIVAPNDYVLDQASTTTPHGKCVTYAWISQRTMMPRGYDLIWFDEFHRIGAETWGDGVVRLIDANPEAKILGTTATEERALEQRNMADEMFSGDVVSHMTISDAWVKKILEVPTYIIGVISMDDTRKDYRGKISRARRLNAAQKSKANAMLDNLVRDWSRSSGVPRILHKYIDNGVKRMIVFAQTIEKLNEVKASLPQWFSEAGLQLASVYEVHSALKKEAKENMRAFEQDESEGVKVLLSVDMLNEGIHVDGVDACMLLRSTISKNLYLQQIGRCFSVGQKHKPVILDLADNITSACGYEGIYEARDRYIHAAGAYEPTDERPDWADDFLIVDTLKQTRELMTELDNVVFDRRDFDEKLAELTAWCAANDRFPLHNHVRTAEMTEEQKTERRLLTFARHNKDREPIIALRERYLKWTFMTFEQRIQAVVEFVNINNRLPAGLRNRSVDEVSKERRDEGNMRAFMYRQRNRPEIAALLEAYHTPDFDEMFAKVEQFVRDNGRMPRSVSKRYEELSEERRSEALLGNFLIKNCNDDRIIAFRLKHADFRSLPPKEKQRIILEWCERNGTFPIGVRDDEEQKRYARYIQGCRNEDFIQTLRDRYGFKSYTERLEDQRQELVDFCEAHGRTPRRNATDPDERRLRCYYETACKRRYDFVEPLREKYQSYKQPRKGELTREGIITELIDFLTTHKRLPRSAGKALLEGESVLSSRMDKVRDDARVAELIEQYTRRRKLYQVEGIEDIEETRIQQLKQFVQEHGYLPAHQTQGLEKILANYFSRKRTKRHIPEVEQIYATYPAKQQYEARQNRQRMIEYVRQYGKPSTKDNRSLWELYTKYKAEEDVIKAMEEFNSRIIHG